MTMTDNTPWTQAQLEIAVRMWSEDKTAEEIGAVLGKSKGAITGKAKRNRRLFPERGAGPRPGKVYADGRVVRAGGGGKQKPKSEGRPFTFGNGRKNSVATLKQKREQCKAEAVEKAAEFISEKPLRSDYDRERLEHAVTLVDLGNCQCRWPLNNGAPYLFCAEVTFSSGYCHEHFRRSLTARGV